MIRLALLPLCLLLSGCFPMPHKAAVTPLVDGKLLSKDKPVGGVAVRAVPLPSDRPCEGDHAEGRSDLARDGTPCEEERNIDATQ